MHHLSSGTTQCFLLTQSHECWSQLLSLGKTVNDRHWYFVLHCCILIVLGGKRTMLAAVPMYPNWRHYQRYPRWQAHHNFTAIIHWVQHQVRVLQTIYWWYTSMPYHRVSKSLPIGLPWLFWVWQHMTYTFKMCPKCKELAIAAQFHKEFHLHMQFWISNIRHQ